jgi:hypothetical protein
MTTAAHEIPKTHPPRTSAVQGTPRCTREVPTSTAAITATTQTAVLARHDASRNVHSQATAAHTAAAAAACPPAAASAGRAPAVILDQGFVTFDALRGLGYHLLSPGAIPAGQTVTAIAGE